MAALNARWWSPRLLCTIGCVLALGGVSQPSYSADLIDRALAQPWDFMQREMPGVPYQLLQAACKEGSLTLYAGNWTAAQNNALQHFRRRFPCVNVQRLELPTGVRRERFLSEARAGLHLADIVQETEPGQFLKQAQEGLLLNYKVSNDKFYPDALKTLFAYPLQVGVVTIAWNTDQVKDKEAALLSEWKGIVNPIWKGRVGVYEPTGGLGVLPWYVAEKMYGQNFFKAMGALKPRIFTGVPPVAAALASGEVDVVFGLPEVALTPLWNLGAPVRWVIPEPGIGTAAQQAITTRAPHPNAAKLYQEYSFTLEGYRAFQELAAAPSRLNYQDPRKVASEPWYKPPKSYFQYDSTDAANASPRIREMFQKLVAMTR